MYSLIAAFVFSVVALGGVAYGLSTNGYQFTWPYVLIALAVLPLWGWLATRSRQVHVSLSTDTFLGDPRVNLLTRLRWIPLALRMVTLGLIIMAIARPGKRPPDYIWVEGIDIVIVLDSSASMSFQDIRPSRMAAGKKNITSFLQKRKHDQVGLVVFGRDTMIQSPLTSDYRALQHIVNAVRIGDIDSYGTALGDGLALGVRQLLRSKARSKVIVVMSDGASNQARHFSPEQAKDLAVESDVRVFTMLLGPQEGMGVNPKLLVELADATGGDYLTSEDGEELELSFKQVRETLEKDRRRKRIVRPVEVLRQPFVLLIALLLLVEMALRRLVWRFSP